MGERNDADLFGRALQRRMKYEPQRQILPEGKGQSKELQRTIERIREELIQNLAEEEATALQTLAAHEHIDRLSRLAAEKGVDTIEELLALKQVERDEETQYWVNAFLTRQLRLYSAHAQALTDEGSEALRRIARRSVHPGPEPKKSVWDWFLEH